MGQLSSASRDMMLAPSTNFGWVRASCRDERRDNVTAPSIGGVSEADGWHGPHTSPGNCGFRRGSARKPHFQPPLVPGSAPGGDASSSNFVLLSSPDLSGRSRNALRAVSTCPVAHRKVRFFWGFPAPRATGASCLIPHCAEPSGANLGAKTMRRDHL